MTSTGAGTGAYTKPSPPSASRSSPDSPVRHSLDRAVGVHESAPFCDLEGARVPRGLDTLIMMTNTNNTAAALSPLAAALTPITPNR